MNRRTRVEDGVEQEVTAFVHAETEGGTGKKLHTVERAMLMRRRCVNCFNGRAGLRRRDDRKNCCEKQRQQHRTATAEYGTPVALSGFRAGIRIRKLED